ncbi:MAG TPA: glycosyltransferase family 4 protein [Steroidobacteraceae bacterium]|jgi:glycosyltransferase involved in cell wall biosynthesis
MATLEFLLPGNPLTATGGYEYDRRIAEGLRGLGWTVRVRSLDSSFPFPTAHALIDAQQQLAALAAGSLVLIDGLALGAMAEVAQAHAGRLQLIGLVHHPLAAETGLSQELAAQLVESERRALQAVRMVIVTSDSTRRALAGYGVAEQRIAVVEPGVEGPHGTHIESYRRLRDENDPLRMLCVATITPRKGHDRLVDALAELREYPWVLNCVGNVERSPETTSALRARIAAAGLEQRIVLTGELDAAALDRQLRSADLFVLATRFEGYGMAVTQALAYGLPVVSTRTGAIADLVSAEAGILVDPNDGTALREALAHILTDSALRVRLAAGAQRVATNLPSWSAASQQLSEVLTHASRNSSNTAFQS